MALTIEGKVTASASAASVAAAITTALTDDIILAYVDVFASCGGGPNTTLDGTTGVAGGGLIWRRRSTTTLLTSYGSGYPVIHEVWWAHAAAALAGVTITATCTNPGSPNYLDLTLFGVNGANLTAPFDVNGSLPATAAHAGTGGTSSHPVAGISTTDADTLELPTLTTAAGFSGIAADATFTLIESFQNFIANTYLGSQSEYKVQAAPLAAVARNVFTGVSDSTNYIAQVDAIQAVAPAPAPAVDYTVKGAKGYRIVAGPSGPEHTFRTVSVQGTGPSQGLSLGNQETSGSGGEYETVYQGPTGASGFPTIFVGGYTGPA